MKDIDYPDCNSIVTFKVKNNIFLIAKGITLHKSMNISNNSFLLKKYNKWL